MRLLDTTTLKLEEFVSADDAPCYAILSHTWEAEEVTFAHFDDPEVECLRGWDKITGACRRARADGYEYIWVDTCCIDKSSSSELSEAINSMFAWYRGAEVCYAYLVDVEVLPGEDMSGDDVVDAHKEDKLFECFPGRVRTTPYAQAGFFVEGTLARRFSSSRWFTRGWTLQELLAPPEVIFYSCDWIQIGTRSTSAPLISLVTGINCRYLAEAVSLNVASIAERMSWAADRQTSRLEDVAYSLLGIFDVNMPLLYGEGNKAFIRLQEEILKQSDDQTLFAWKNSLMVDEECFGLLAPEPACFRDSRDFLPYQDLDTHPPFTMTNKGLNVSMGLAPLRDRSGLFMGLLNCASGPHYEGFTTVYLKRMPGVLPQYVRVRCSELGMTEKWKPPKPIFIRQRDIVAGPRRIWPKSIFILRDGPDRPDETYPLADVVSIVPGALDVTGRGHIPTLRRPHPGHPSLNIVAREDVSLWEKRARWWIPDHYPMVYIIPKASDLIAVALEFHLPNKSRMVFMLGSSGGNGIGYDCLLLDHQRPIRLEHCGEHYNPTFMGVARIVGNYSVRVASDTKIRGHIRVCVVDIEIRCLND